MKIVQINCSASGSTGNIAKAIHHEASIHGYESYIFFGFGTPTCENMFRIGNYFDLHIHAVLSRNLGKQGYFSRFSTLKLVQKLKDIAPDIIHLHNLHGSYLNLPILFKFLKKSNAKIVITLHDCWLFTGKCPHFTLANCDKWKYSCGNCPQLSLYPKSKVDTTTSCLNDKRKWLSEFGNRLHIISVSNWLQDTAKNSHLSGYPIETIYNGIDENVFKPTDGSYVRQKFKLENKFVILGVSSNWNTQKGLDEFVSLSKQLSSDEIIVLVGLTEEQMKSMPENIIGIAHTENRAELANLYSAANVFVNLSREETFGLVTAEAMACGTRVIVYDSTACAEIVSAEAGLILDSKNSNSLSDAIKSERRASSPKHRTVFSEKTMLYNYFDLYRRICSE